MLCLIAVMKFILCPLLHTCMRSFSCYMRVTERCMEHIAREENG